MHPLLEEIKRRNVFRVAAAYIVASWLVLQVSDIVLQGIEAPAWVMKVFLLVLTMGFPFAIAFSWAYELTPEGLKKEKDVDRSTSITPETGRKLDMLTIGMLVLVLIVFAIDRQLPKDEVQAAPAAATEAPEQSIAVLAFEDLSPEGDQAYFAEGLSEELLNVLAQRPDLQVAGRTSSFAFKGQNRDLREIGELLNVSHVLEGSVRKAGNRIRVTAQLIEATTGYHLFSETYDRELSDIFLVQDQIAAEISSALLSEIIGTEVATATQTDPQAFELYLMARQRIHTRDLLNMQEADAMLDRALEIDPIYAPALAQKALVTYLMSDALGAYGDIPADFALPESIRFVKQAIALDDSLAEAHAVYGLLLDSSFQVQEAIGELELALDINPTMTDAGNWLSSAYQTDGRPDEGREVLEKVVERDPTFGPAFNNLIADYTRISAFDKASGLIDRVERIVGRNDDVHYARGTVAIMRGDSAEASRLFSESYEINPNSSVQRMWYGFALSTTAEFERLAEVGNVEHRMLAKEFLGYPEAAMEELERINLQHTYAPRVLRDIGDLLVLRGESQQFIDYTMGEYGDLDSLFKDASVEEDWGSAYLGPLAWAYRDVGDEQAAARVLDEMRRILDIGAAKGHDNWVPRYSEAEYAALTGDVEKALTMLRAAIDSGYRYVEGLSLPTFELIRDDQRFVDLKEELVAIRDAQRAELGLGPYRPLPKDASRPTFVN